MRKRVVFWLFLALTVLWIAFIFSNSLDNGTESGEKSSAVTALVNTVAHVLGYGGEISERSVRVLAHFGEFAVLSLLVCADVTLFKSSPLLLCALSVPVCFLIACVDELIQNFSDGRAMQFSDVLTDTSGALCAALAFLAVRALLLSIKGRKEH